MMVMNASDMRNYKNVSMESIEEDRAHGGFLFPNHVITDRQRIMRNTQSYKLKRRFRDWEYTSKPDHQSYYGDRMVTDDSEIEEEDEDDNISLTPDLCQDSHSIKNSKRMKFNPKPKQPWWKHQACSNTITNPASSSPGCRTHATQCCFICQSTASSSNYHPRTKRKMSQNGKDNAYHHTSSIAGSTENQTNSLLSYFKPKTAISLRSKAKSHLPQKPEKLPLVACSYCERLACNPECVQTCESCVKLYCTFCSTINYDGPMERTFCLDCSHQLPSPSTHIDNRMEE